MKIKVPAFLLVLILSISNSFMSADAATKAGSACTKVGLTSTNSGKTLVCSKSGKKLIWVAKASTGIDSYREAAYSQSHLKSCGSSHPNINVEYFVPEDYPTDMLVKQKGFLEATLNCYGSYFDTQITLRASFVTEKDFTYAEQNAASLYGTEFTPVVTNILNRYKNKAWGNNVAASSGQAGYNNKNGKYFFIIEDGSYTPASALNQKVTIHEFVHVMQSYSRKNFYTTYNPGDAMSYKNTPKWFWEGTAEAFSIGLYSSTFSNYESYMLRNSLGMREGSATYKGKQTAESINQLFKKVENEDSQELNDLGYPVGALLSEYMLAKYGYAKYIELLQGLGKYQTFDENLQKTFGISIDQLYSAATPYVLLKWNA
jgi:hypothetical protein